MKIFLWMGMEMKVWGPGGFGEISTGTGWDGENS